MKAHPRSDKLSLQSQLLLGDNLGDETVDWLGRSSKRRRLGGWRAGIYVLGAQTLSFVAYGGIALNLVLYLTRVLQKSNATAANDVTDWMGTMYATSLLGAFLADAYFGRLWTCFLYQVLFTMGFALLSLSASHTSTDVSDDQNPSRGRSLLFFSALYIVALGQGSFQPISLTYGADQFDLPGNKSKFFNMYLGLTNFGMAISSTVISYLENNGRWALGFWMSTVVATMSFLIFLAGMPISRQYRPGGNFLSRIAQVLVAAFLKCRVAVPSNSNDLYEMPHNVSAIRGSRKILHSENFRWMDKAAVITANDELQTNLLDRWRLCTVTQVEEVKCVCRLLPFWVCAVFFNAILSQMSTLFTEQGDVMDNHFGTFRIPPASMNLFNVLTITLASPIYLWIVVPCVRWYRRDGKDVTSLQRMGVGLVASMIAMSVAALVEMKRLTMAAKQKSQGDLIYPASMSIFWLVPQYVLQGFAQVLFVCGHMDFNYSQSPDAMRSLGGSLALSSLSVGSFMSTLLVSIVTDLTTQLGSVGWIPQNLNQGHLDYFYWLLVGVLGCTLFAFLICAHWYTYIQVENWQLDDLEEQQHEPVHSGSWEIHKSSGMDPSTFK